jgi:hypothetical protein
MPYTFNPFSGRLDYYSDLSGYVPYTGATSDVNLGSYALTTTGIGTFGSLVTTVGGFTLLSGQDIKPSSNSTTAMNISQADGTNFVTFDTTNKRTLFGSDSGLTIPTTTLHLAGTTSSHYAQIDTGLNFNWVTPPATAGFTVALVEDAGAGGLGDGTYYYWCTYYTTLGETQVLGSGNVKTIVTDATHETVLVTIPVSTDYRVIGRKVYRSKVNGQSYNVYLTKTIADNTTTTFNDTLADASQGTVNGGYLENTTNSQIFVNSATAFKSQGYSLYVGYAAGNVITGGGYNCFVGARAGSSATTAQSSTYVGSQAGQTATTGAGNVGVGFNACGSSVTFTGGANVGVGYDALYQMSSASESVGVGYLAGGKLTTGNYNVFVGSQSGYGGVARGISNMVCLGYKSGAYETVSSKLFIDALDRTDEATSRIQSLIYGTFNATVASQQLTINAGTLNLNAGIDTDLIINFTGTTNSGLLNWMEDEDYFKYSDGILMNSTEELFFNATTEYIKSANAGYLDLGANTGIRLNQATSTAYQLTSTLATGTSPLAVSSTTLNTNLNADLLDGQHGSYYQTALTTGNMTASSPILVDNTRQVIGGAVVISHATTDGNIHLPSGGSSNQILKNSTSGTGVWGTVTESSGALGSITTLSMNNQLTNTLAGGTKPFVITSTTMCDNLNADLWDGYQFSDYLNQAVKTTSAPTFTDMTFSDMQIGTPTYSTIGNLIDITNSGGRINGGLLTAGTAVCNYSAMRGVIKDQGVSPLKFFDIDAGSVALTDNATNWVYLDYNSGTPQVLATTIRSFISLVSQFIMGQAYREGDNVKVLSAGNTNFNFQRSVYERDIARAFFERTSGSILSETGTRQILCTAGIYYSGYTRFLTGIYNSSTENFDHYYYMLNGAWTVLSATGQINNTQYNLMTPAGSESLATLTDGFYGVHWIYQNSDGDVDVVLGNGSYTLSQAYAVQVPTSIPNYLTYFANLIGKIIILKNAATFTSIESAFTAKFTSQAVNVHNDTIGIQGGTTSQYYHLTSAEYTGTGTNNFVRQTSPTLTTPNIGVATGTSFQGIIGNVTPDAITGTTIQSNTGIVPDANDGAYLGTSSLGFSDLFLAEGGVINWDNGDFTITQTGDVLAFAGGTLTFPTPFTLGATSVTSTGTQLNYLNAVTGTTGTTNTNLVFSTSPVFTTPNIGIATATGNIKGMPQHLRFTILDPHNVYDMDTQICIWNKTDAALTVTNLEVTCDANPATQIFGDVKYADTFIGLGTPVVINDFDTTNGVRSDSTITSGSVAAGKCIYIQFDSQPIQAITQINFDLQFDYD